MLSRLLAAVHWLPRTGMELAVLAYSSLLLINLLAAGIGGRYLSLCYQWRARDYGQVDAAVRSSIPPGSVVWGPAEVWYAVENAGSSLRLAGEPDRKVHDYMILRPGSGVLLRGKAERILEFGVPLPPVFGSLRRASADYTFEIWRWR
jgi:hypothetical protein